MYVTPVPPYRNRTAIGGCGASSFEAGHGELAALTNHAIHFSTWVVSRTLKPPPMASTVQGPERRLENSPSGGLGRSGFNLNEETLPHEALSPILE